MYIFHKLDSTVEIAIGFDNASLNIRQFCSRHFSRRMPFLASGSAVGKPCAQISGCPWRIRCQELSTRLAVRILCPHPKQPDRTHDRSRYFAVGHVNAVQEEFYLVYHWHMHEVRVLWSRKFLGCNKSVYCPDRKSSSRLTKRKRTDRWIDSLCDFLTKTL